MKWIRRKTERPEATFIRRSTERFNESQYLKSQIMTYLMSGRFDYTGLSHFVSRIQVLADEQRAERVPGELLQGQQHGYVFMLDQLADLFTTLVFERGRRTDQILQTYASGLKAHREWVQEHEAELNALADRLGLPHVQIPADPDIDSLLERRKS